MAHTFPVLVDVDWSDRASGRGCTVIMYTSISARRLVLLARQKTGLLANESSSWMAWKISYRGPASRAFQESG